MYKKFKLLVIVAFFLIGGLCAQVTVISGEYSDLMGKKGHVFKSICQATASVDIIMGRVDDSDLVKRLEQFATQHKVSVRILCDQGLSSACAKKSSYFELKPVKGPTKTINPPRGNPFKQTPFMHPKMVIIDNARVIAGSCNFSPDGGGMECMLDVDDAGLALALKGGFDSYFNGTWQPGQKHEGHTGTYQSFDAKTTAFFMPNIDMFTWSRGSGQNKLFTMINQAKDSIVVSAQSLTNNAVVNALQRAKNRGVRIVVKYKKMEPKGRFTQLNDYGELKGCMSRGSSHIRAVVIDEKHVFVGSAKMSGAGLYTNTEFYLLVSDNERVAKKVASAVEEGKKHLPVMTAPTPTLPSVALHASQPQESATEAAVRNQLANSGVRKSATGRSETSHQAMARRYGPLAAIFALSLGAERYAAHMAARRQRSRMMALHQKAALIKRYHLIRALGALGMLGSVGWGIRQALS